MMHPMNRPGTAAGVKTGRIVRASEILTCTSLKEIGAKSVVSTTYRAAIIAPCVRNRTFLSFISSCLLSFVLREDGFELTVLPLSSDSDMHYTINSAGNQGEPHMKNECHRFTDAGVLPGSRCRMIRLSPLYDM